jgi:acetylornithine deacetylase/succinyl-diaminopimelate desuccinylase-like protein
MLPQTRSRFLILALPILLIVGATLPALGDPADAAMQARSWRQAHEQKIIRDFVALLSIPNVASDSPNILRNAQHISDLLEARQFEVQLLEAAGSPPAVFAERNSPGANKTLMIYVHYDGQPVNPDDWASDPWTPVMRDASVENGGQIVPMVPPFDPEWRIFSRSAGDDKAPVIALTAALDALDDAGIAPSVNLKLFFEGEEEAGSPHLREMLTLHRDLLGADLWLFCDGPVHQSRRWQLSYGVRGSFGFDLTVYGPNRPLHSGHYGNWSPNPIARLTELIATMRDGEGKILVDGFHDQVIAPTPLEIQAIEAAPEVDSSLIRELGVGPESNERIEMALMRPAMNLRGIRSGDVGEQARNSIQTQATASIGLRLVPAQTPGHLRHAIERHINAQGYLIVTQEPTAGQRANHDRIALLDWSEAGYPAYRAPFDLPIAKSVASIINQLGHQRGDNHLIELPTMGGSLPLYLIDEVVGAPILILPIANHDNNQHGKDENLRLQNLWDAIEIYAAVLTHL